MKIGPVHFRLVRRSGEVPAFGFEAAECYARLREIAASLRGLAWMVVSGLAAPLAAGKFARHHSDIDIAVPREQLAPAAAALGSLGYVLTTRAFKGRLGTRYHLEAHVRIAPAWLRWRQRRLRFWRVHPDGRFDEGRFPRYLDLYAYHLRGREMHVLDTGWRYVFPGPMVLMVDLPGGGTVPVENPDYRRLPKRSARARLLARPDADEA